MGRQFITYWKTDDLKFAFYNRLDVIKGLGCVPVESVPFDEFFPLEDSSHGENWKAIKSVCRLFDRNYSIKDGSYFTCSNKDGSILDWTFVTVSEKAIENNIVDPHIPKFKLKNSNLWCVQCIMEPEPIDDNEPGDDDIFI